MLLKPNKNTTTPELLIFWGCCALKTKEARKNNMLAERVFPLHNAIIAHFILSCNHFFANLLKYIMRM